MPCFCECPGLVGRSINFHFALKDRWNRWKKRKYDKKIQEVKQTSWKVAPQVFLYPFVNPAVVLFPRTILFHLYFILPSKSQLPFMTKLWTNTMLQSKVTREENEDVWFHIFTSQLNAYISKCYVLFRFNSVAFVVYDEVPRNPPRNNQSNRRWWPNTNHDTRFLHWCLM